MGLKQTASAKFAREKTALKFYLLGSNFNKAITALAEVEQLIFKAKKKDRYRKDNVTPSLQHQVSIALAVTNLNLEKSFEEDLIASALLHDVIEDFDLEKSYIAEKYGDEIAETVWMLTKKFKGESKTSEEYINGIGSCIKTAIIKGLDRSNNLSTMLGVFDLIKIKSYAAESKNILSAMKLAAKLFPEHIKIINGISMQIKDQIKFAEEYVFSMDLVKKSAEIASRKEQIVSQRLTDVNQQLTDVNQQLEQLKQEHEKLKSSIESNMVISSNMKREVFMMLVNSIPQKLSHLVKINELSGQSGSQYFMEHKVNKISSEIISEIMQQMGISTLELQSFTSDEV
jgi:(p)ppGpp synthase/HD superfamily hydrolase